MIPFSTEELTECNSSPRGRRYFELEVRMVVSCSYLQHHYSSWNHCRIGWWAVLFGGGVWVPLGVGRMDW